MDLRTLAEPIVQAPLAGGVSTPRLAAAVSSGGGPFLAAGYKTVAAVRQNIESLRALSDAPFGLMFRPPAPAPEAGLLEAYAAELKPESQRYGAALGEPRHDDDEFAAKLELAREERVPIVSSRSDARSRAWSERCTRRAAMSG